MATRFLFAVTIVLFVCIDGSGQAGILSGAERSDYTSTSDYKDISGFLFHNGAGDLILIRSVR